MEEYYSSRMLHDAAARWGLAVLPGRPRIGLTPFEESRGDEGIAGNPYVQEPIADCEVFQAAFENGRVRCSLHLFTFNGRWGFSMAFVGRGYGFAWGNFLHFCEPYETRGAALAGAAGYLRRRLSERGGSAVIGWAQALSEPVQLELWRISG